ncbi:MAG TPA: hypothetical protein PK360_16445, partial [bacterium]|nr:hypothetical protein [bacterium]
PMPGYHPPNPMSLSYEICDVGKRITYSLSLWERARVREDLSFPFYFTAKSMLIKKISFRGGIRAAQD